MKDNDTARTNSSLFQVTCVHLYTHEQNYRFSPRICVNPYLQQIFVYSMCDLLYIAVRSLTKNQHVTKTKLYLNHLVSCSF